MAELLKCDNCGKLSPDENGYSIANIWYTIRISGGSGLHGWQRMKELLVCNKCMGTSIPAWDIVASYLLGKIKKLFKL